ncbi:hypothetical protein, partial [Flavobacterium sp. Sd200]|uniref:hypothetical protein n=1 Tax=Flavobacterium sp. Sd200 TaxID=2692211 RepID=UPI001F276FF6
FTRLKIQVLKTFNFFILSFSKRLQNYNFFLNSQAFFEKKFIFLSFVLKSTSLAMNSLSFRFGWAKIKSFSLIIQAFFYLFFQPFSKPIL